MSHHTMCKEILNQILTNIKNIKLIVYGCKESTHTPLALRIHNKYFLFCNHLNQSRTCSEPKKISLGNKVNVI